MNNNMPYPIGTPGKPWGADERALWLARQVVQRSYQADVCTPVLALREHFEVTQYGQLDHDPVRLPLLALRSKAWNDALPTALVTGGVHGYETSGVHGAMRFLEQRAGDYAGRCNLVVAPCVSPWAYEVVSRWNRQAVDPNRSFKEPCPAQDPARPRAQVRRIEVRISV